MRQALLPPHFADGAAEAQRVRNLPKVSWPVCGRMVPAQPGSTWVPEASILYNFCTSHTHGQRALFFSFFNHVLCLLESSLCVSAVLTPSRPVRAIPEVLCPLFLLCSFLSDSLPSSPVHAFVCLPGICPGTCEQGWGF